MGLFSSGNKDAAPSRRSKAPADRPADGRRTRGENRGQPNSLLDPILPEKQRARQRLVGAIALVLAAVVGLPMVLDSHPHPAADDIAIDIPRASKSGVVSGADTPAAAAGLAAPDPVTAGAGASAAPGAPVAPLAASAGKTAPGSAGTTAARAVPAQNAQFAPGAPAAPVPMAAQTAAAPSQNATSQSAAAAAAPQPAPHAAAPAAGSRFVVSVGSFASDASAHAWLNKLKSAGVPAYLEQRHQADGSTRTLLRAGPFTDRASAEAAVKKVRAAGLSAQSGDAAGAGK